MARRPLLLTVLALAALTASPAAAGEDGGRTKHTFTAPVPCSVVCPYWAAHVNDTDEASCVPNPSTLPGSYADLDLSLAAPETPSLPLVQFSIYPDVDFDAWLCLQVPHPRTGKYWVATGSSILASITCRGPLGMFGCDEHIDLVVCADRVWPDVSKDHCLPVGTPLRWRVYNWSDPFGQVSGEYGPPVRR